MIAAVEGGGTTWVCATALASSPTELVEVESFPTTTPVETLTAISEWLSKRTFDSLGIACFGPIDPDESSETYGYITETPKPGWQNTDVVGFLRDRLPGDKNIPIAFDTDVNAPALAEARQSHFSSLAYVTVGTGVGVGLVVNGAPVHGLLHPEAGHISCPRFPADEDFDDSGLTSLDCPGWFEVEAMCATRALARRAGVPAQDLKNLPDDHEVWEACSHYLAAMCANLVLVVSPQKIILSGGVMQRDSLFPKIRRKVVKMLNGYIPVKRLQDEDFITPSQWGNRAGIIGALALTQKS